jgi:hypothetical protein
VDGSRACVTVIVVEATVSVPVRERPLFGATLNVAEPVPLLLAPDVIVIHDALLWAVQRQPFGEETDTDAPVSPPNGND